MKKIILVFLISVNVFAQTEEVYEAIESSRYTDYKNGYSIQIPDWFIEKQTNDSNLWGGVFPKTNNIENAVIITGFDKKYFESFEDFQRVFITGNVFGKETLFSKAHIWYGRNERDFQVIQNGVSSRVFTFWNDKIYHNQFVLLETSTSYLFVNFCATPETYEENLPKFNELMDGLKIE